MTIITPLRIHQLKQELVADCQRIAAELGCDLEGEMIRRGLCSPTQARYAARGKVPRVSLARLLDFTFVLRDAVWDRFANMADCYGPYDDGVDAYGSDDNIPY